MVRTCAIPGVQRTQSHTSPTVQPGSAFVLPGSTALQTPKQRPLCGTQPRQINHCHALVNISANFPENVTADEGQLFQCKSLSAPLGFPYKRTTADAITACTPPRPLATRHALHQQPALYWRHGQIRRLSPPSQADDAFHGVGGAWRGRRRGPTTTHARLGRRGGWGAGDGACMPSRAARAWARAYIFVDLPRVRQMEWHA